MNKATDWTAYYSKVPKYTSVTRSISENKILKLLRSVVNNDQIDICELGGANSFIAESMSRELNVNSYHVVDNNELGLKLLEDKNIDNLTYENQDALQEYSGDKQYDVVFSVGLIEHFDPEGTRKCVDNHFSRCKTGGWVLITFPTPTLLYKIIRGSAEILKMWKFHDERPLQFIEVERYVSQWGSINHKSINWAIGLTQGYLLVRKN